MDEEPMRDFDEALARGPSPKMATLPVFAAFDTLIAILLAKGVLDENDVAQIDQATRLANGLLRDKGKQQAQE